jgi:hypothetical protein
MKHKEFEILLSGFGFELILILTRMKATTFYSHYKYKSNTSVQKKCMTA